MSLRLIIAMLAGIPLVYVNGYAAEIKGSSKSESSFVQKTTKIKNFVEPVSGIEFVFVKGGCFKMGDTFGDGQPDEKPVHNVCLDDFYIGKYEVTHGQWKKVMGSYTTANISGYDYPVDYVSWDMIQVFTKKLNDHGNGVYRLPTEAEWEYAAKGGKDDKWGGTSKEKRLGAFAWYDKNAYSHVEKVGQKKPNKFGIYDMSGNILEWCNDWYDEKYYSISPEKNPQGSASGGKKVLRSGLFARNSLDARTAYRYSDDPDTANGDNGFRLVKSAK